MYIDIVVSKTSFTAATTVAEAEAWWNQLLK